MNSKKNENQKGENRLDPDNERTEELATNEQPQNQKKLFFYHRLDWGGVV